MRILTLENRAYNLETLPDVIDDMRFSVLDNSDPSDADYFFIPLIYLESFHCPAVVLKIGDHTIKMPMDWQLLIGDLDSGDLEMLPLTSLNDRGFSAFTFNALSSFRAEFYPVEIVDVYHEVTWYAPKLKNGQMLSVPLSDDEKPICAYFVKDISRGCEVVDVNQAW